MKNLQLEQLCFQPQKGVSRYFLCLFFLLAGAIAARGQNPQIARARQEIEQATVQDTHLIIKVVELAWMYYGINVDSSEYFASRSLGLSRELHSNKGIGASYNLIALVRLKQERMQEALNILDTALYFAGQANDSFNLCAIHNNRAIIYDQYGQPEESLKYYQSSLKFSSGTNLRSRAYINSNIGRLYAQLGYDSLSKQYLQKVVSMKDTLSDPTIWPIFKYSESLYLELQGQPERAARSAEEGWKYCREREIHEMSIRFAEILIRYYRQTDRPEKALEILRRITPAVNQYSKANALIFRVNMMQILTELQQYDEVIRLGQLQAGQFENYKYQYQLMVSFHHSLVQAYSHMGLIHNAYHSLEEMGRFKDSLYRIETAKAVADLEFKYQIRQKEAENLALRQTQEIDKQELRTRRRTNNALWIILLLNLVIGLLLWLNIRQKKNFNARLRLEVRQKTASLEAQNRELEGFAHIVSHDLKEPMRNIVSFINLLERREKLSADGQAYFGFVQKGVRQLYALVDDVLLFSKIGKAPARSEPVDLQEVMHEVTAALGLLTQEKNAVVEYQDLPEIQGVRSRYFLILKNLVENALMYNTSGQAIVRVSYQLLNGKHHLFVEDNGDGIPADYREKVFEMFYRLHDRATFSGSGLGLAIVKKLVDSMGGSIRIEEGLQGMTTRFCVIFP